MSEVCKHTLQESAWIVVHDHIYDSNHSTKFLMDHPAAADTDTNYT
jgi:cytochrome b involved in lipid metabolism